MSDSLPWGHGDGADDVHAWINRAYGVEPRDVTARFTRFNMVTAYRAGETEAAALIESLQKEVAELKAENERAWTERNTAYAKVKGWESVVYVEKLPMRAVPIDEWGPGEGGQTAVPHITPAKLTDLLDEIAKLRALTNAP